jgi:hypothetical protein
VRLEGLGQLKNPMNSSGYETATFRLVAVPSTQKRTIVKQTVFYRIGDWHGSVSTNTNLWSGRQRNRGSFPDRGQDVHPKFILKLFYVTKTNFKVISELV